jgi:hypothetical protein
MEIAKNSYFQNSFYTPVSNLDGPKYLPSQPLRCFIISTPLNQSQGRIWGYGLKCNLLHMKTYHLSIFSSSKFSKETISDLAIVTPTCNPSFQDVQVGELQSEAGPGKSVRPYLKNKLKSKETRGVA